MQYFQARVEPTAENGNAKFELPTGDQLMSAPMFDASLSRKEKEKRFVIANVEKNLADLVFYTNYQAYKAYLFMVALLCGIIGSVLIMMGISYSVFFMEMPFDPVKIGIGSLLCVPFLCWFVWLFIPTKNMHNEREKMHELKAERVRPTLFNEMVEKASNMSKPPVKKIRVFASFRQPVTSAGRRVDFSIVCATLEEFQEEVYKETGLAPFRQLIKYKGNEIYIPELRLDDGYNIRPDDTLYIWNKGGYLTPYKTADGIVRANYKDGIIPQEQLDELEEQRSIATWKTTAGKFGTPFEAVNDTIAAKTIKTKIMKQKAVGGGLVTIGINPDINDVVDFTNDNESISNTTIKTFESN